MDENLRLIAGVTEREAECYAPRADALFRYPTPEEVGLCMEEIVPAVQRLVAKGVHPSAVIKILADATMLTLEHGRSIKTDGHTDCT